jgi:hypothetical protein
MEKELKSKIKELCKKYEIPEDLLVSAISLEREKVVLQNRRLAPKLLDMVERYANLFPNSSGREKGV